MKPDEIRYTVADPLALVEEDDRTLSFRVRCEEQRHFMEWLGTRDCMDAIGRYPHGYAMTGNDDALMNSMDAVGRHPYDCPMTGNDDALKSWSRAAEKCEASHIIPEVVKEAFYFNVVVHARMKDNSVCCAGLRISFDEIFKFETFSDMKLMFLSLVKKFILKDMRDMLVKVVSDGYLDGRKSATPYCDVGKDDKDLEESRKPHNGGKPVTMFEAAATLERKREEERNNEAH